MVYYSDSVSKRLCMSPPTHGSSLGFFDEHLKRSKQSEQSQSQRTGREKLFHGSRVVVVFSYFLYIP